MYLRPLIIGLASYIPGLRRACGAGRTGGTDSARYCYSVWLRHLVCASENGLPTNPQVVAELGPGDSIGIGLAALILGAQKYFAFDRVPFARVERNLAVFDDLVRMFQNRERIPGPGEFPHTNPTLHDYDFPSKVLTASRLEEALNPKRLQRLREAIQSSTSDVITYRAPWFQSGLVQENTVDLVFSQAVMEHVDNVAETYQAIYVWLRRGGFMSHQIDFKSHGTSAEWNGHWRYGDFQWKLIRGIRPYLLNREPLSTHLQLIEQSGFSKIACLKVKANSDFTLEKVANRFKTMRADDLTTSGALVQAVK